MNFKFEKKSETPNNNEEAVLIKNKGLLEKATGLVNDLKKIFAKGINIENHPNAKEKLIFLGEIAAVLVGAAVAIGIGSTIGVDYKGDVNFTLENFVKVSEVVGTVLATAAGYGILSSAEENKDPKRTATA